MYIIQVNKLTSTKNDQHVYFRTDIKKLEQALIKKKRSFD